MNRLRRVLRFAFIVGPCRLYLAGEAGGGEVPLRWLAAIGGAGAAGAGVGAVWGQVSGSGAADAVILGVVMGLAVMPVWGLYSLLVLAVLWVLGRSPTDVVLSERQRRGDYSGRHEGPVEEVSWRRRGHDQLVPLSLVAFFAFMTVVGVAGGAWDHYHPKTFTGPTKTTQATVRAWDDGWWGFGDRVLVVDYTAAGRGYHGRVKADDVGDATAVPSPGQSLSIEYLLTEPTQIRPAGLVSSVRSDTLFYRRLTEACAALLLLSGAGYLVGARRHP